MNRSTEAAQFSDQSNATLLFSSLKNAQNVTAEDLNNFKIADVVNRYVPPVLVVAGAVFNILSIIVMRTRHFRSISTSVYMITCAANDALSLCVALPPHWLYVNFPGIFIRNQYSHIMCKFFNFYGWGNCDYTIALTAAMTVDRAIAIMYPLKVSVFNLVRRAKITVFLLLLVVAAKEFHFLFFSTVAPATRRERLCIIANTSASYMDFYDNVWPWIHIVFLTLCFVCIIISNAIIIWNVRKSADFSDAMSRSSRKGSFTSASWSNLPSRTRLRQVTTMLVAQSTTLLVLTYPFSLHLAISAQISDIFTDPVKKANNQLAFSVVFYLLYSNKCVNFVIYCVSGERFRASLREMCRRRGTPRPTATISNAVSQSTISSIAPVTSPDPHVQYLDKHSG